MAFIVSGTTVINNSAQVPWSSVSGATYATVAQTSGGSSGYAFIINATFGGGVLTFYIY